MSVELANAVASRFIARADAKAVQRSNGEYTPCRKNLGDRDSELIPWSRDDVLAHLAGKASYGHYVLDTNSTCKLITFDIDLVEKAPIPPEPYDTSKSHNELLEWETTWPVVDVRAAWHDRANPARNWFKSQFRAISAGLASHIHRDLGLDCAIAYSGNKGLHVYGFTGRTTGLDAREGAELVLESMGGWSPVPKRASTYVHEKYQHLNVEIYPKQDTIPEGSFGNLVRLPLGRNLKCPSDPTFFVDLNAPLNVLRPIDPLWALTTGAKNPWVIRD